MILVDTSAWIDFFRGRGRCCRRVDEALEANDVALCGPVATELRRGLRTQRERTRVLPLFDACHWLSEPPELWNEAGDLGFALARRGVAVKSMDLLIATFALSHSTSILTNDSDFAAMQRAGVGLSLAEI